MVPTGDALQRLSISLNHMLARLRDSVSTSRRFQADASHELRTPLAVILSHAELALDKNRPANELRETIEEIIEDHPDLERDDLLAALEFGALVSAQRQVPLGAA